MNAQDKTNMFFQAGLTWPNTEIDNLKITQIGGFKSNQCEKHTLILI